MVYGSQNDAAEHDEVLTHDLVSMNLIHAFRVIIAKTAFAEGKVTQATRFLSYRLHAHCPFHKNPQKKQNLILFQKSI